VSISLFTKTKSPPNSFILTETLDELRGPRGFEVTAYRLMDPAYGLLNSLSVHPNDNVDVLLAIACFRISDVTCSSYPVVAMRKVIGERVLSRPNTLPLHIKTRVRQLFDVRAWTSRIHISRSQGTNSTSANSELSSHGFSSFDMIYL
jgi:hypothetical protein